MNEQLPAALIVAIFAAAVLTFVVVALVSIVRYFQSTSRNSPTVKPQPAECTSEEESDECTSAEEDSPVQYKYQVILMIPSAEGTRHKIISQEVIARYFQVWHKPNLVRIVFYAAPPKKTLAAEYYDEESSDELPLHAKQHLIEVTRIQIPSTWGHQIRNEVHTNFHCTE